MRNHPWAQGPHPLGRIGDQSKIACRVWLSLLVHCQVLDLAPICASCSPALVQSRDWSRTMRSQLRRTLRFVSLIAGILFLISRLLTRDASSAPTAPMVALLYLKLPARQDAPPNTLLHKSGIHILPARSNAAQAAFRASLVGARTSAPMLRLFANGSEYYPSDLTKGPGPIVPMAINHFVYVDCAPSCWGDPAGFMRDLGLSDMIHIVDQYVGSTAPQRYTVGASTQVSYGDAATLRSNDILNILHAAALQIKVSGYDHIYHIFLAKGVELCQTPTECYSPSTPATFTFCAYHGSATFTDAGHLLYTVEPYQGELDSDLTGCAELVNPLPNSPLVDSTDSTLSHETFETITDPDPVQSSLGWTAQSPGVAGYEIGDLCSGSYYPVSLNGHKYSMQLEYSNRSHSCTSSP